MSGRTLAALAAALVGYVVWGVVPAAAVDPELTPFVAEALWAPHVAIGSDGRRHLVYELRISNTTASGLEFKSIDILDEPSGKVLASLDRDGLGKRFSIGGRRGAESADLGVGQFGVLFLHVALDPTAPVPKAIAHRLALRLAQPGVDFAATVAQTPIVDHPPVVLGPPLIGAGYIAADGCCDTIRHVRALLAINGHFTLAQRFAIDWEQADAENRLVKGDTKALANYTIYGREILAVADGTVVSSRNDLPEQMPGALPAGMTVAEADGNFVVLDIGGSYVLYAHMQPGSVTVKAGATVKRGDVLGKVGNTGNSQAPHLHLHVTNGPSPLVSNGIPYVFDSFKLTAIDKAGTADFDKAEATGSPLTLTPVLPSQALERVLPLDLSVVEFSR
jgi:hypothetical protein